MAAKTVWKLYRGKEFVASFKHPEDAAALCWSEGDKVKWNHTFLVWEEGKEKFPAGSSYDRAGEVMRERFRAQWAASIARSDERRKKAWVEIQAMSKRTNLTLED
jgi:hypothetical protein